MILEFDCAVVAFGQPHLDDLWDGLSLATFRQDLWKLTTIGEWLRLASRFVLVLLD